MAKRKTSKKSSSGKRKRSEASGNSANINEAKSSSSSSQRRSSRKRIERKQNAQQKRNLLIGGAIVAIVVVIGAFLLLSNGETGGTGGAVAASAVEQERLDQDAVLGNPDATVTIIEYGAYGCPACRSWHQSGIVDQLIAEYGGRVNHIFRNFPVISPAYDRMSAELAQCVLDQSEERFWAFHDALYSSAGPGTSRDDLIALAGRNGADAEALRACADAGTHQQTVEYHLQQGFDLGLRGTPSFFVNDQRLFNPSPDLLRQTIGGLLN